MSTSISHRENTSTVPLGHDVDLPIDVVTQALAIVGKRGRGKTSTAKVLVEGIVRAGEQSVVLDTVGAWWGLRSSLDGAKPGLPVVVFGGAHGDVPIEDTSGAVIARVLMTHRIPAVVDLSAFRKAGMRRFATDFLEELYHSNRDPIHLVFDEADEFAPQQPYPESRRLLGAMEDIVRRGRLRGIGCSLVSQRPAVIHKDVLTQVEILITMGLTGPRDVAAINEWVKLHATEEEAREVRQSLASLPVGTAWVWSPEWLEMLQKVAIRRITTFDSSATPKVGQKVAQPKARAKIDIEALGAEVAATVEKAQHEDPRVLQRKVAQLEKELAAANAPKTSTPPKIIEVPALASEDRDQLSDHVSDLERHIASMEKCIVYARDLVRALNGVLGPQEKPPPQADRRRSRPSAAPAPQVTGVENDLHLSRAEKAITTALAVHGVLSQQQISLHTGYSRKSGSFANNLSKLRTRGLIVGPGDAIEITADGTRALEANGGYDPLPSGRALPEWWLARLPKAQSAMLRVLLDAYPGSMTADQLAAATGYSPTSGSFASNRSKLNVAELIHGSRDGLYADSLLGEVWR